MRGAALSMRARGVGCAWACLLTAGGCLGPAARGPSEPPLAPPGISANARVTTWADAAGSISRLPGALAASEEFESSRGARRWNASSLSTVADTSDLETNSGLPNNAEVVTTDAAAEEAQRRRASWSEAWGVDTVSRDWRYVVLHHTATAGGDVAQLDREHRGRTDRQGRPWRGVAYHFVIGNGQGMGDGVVEPTFRWREQLAGAHAGGEPFNAQGIGVCLVGNFDEQAPSERQQRAALELIDYLVERHEIPRSNIVGHRDIKATACPGRLFPLARLAGGSSQATGRLPTREVDILAPR